MIKILLAEEDTQLRRGLRMRLELEADFAIGGETGDHLDAIRLANAIQPDVMVMDFPLRGIDGFSAVHKVLQAAPGCRVIILALHEDPDVWERARTAGAAAIVSKREPDDALIHAIRKAAAQTNRTTWRNDKGENA